MVEQGARSRAVRDQLTSFKEYRTLFEFALPPELLAPGVLIHQATLVAPIVSAGWSGVGDVIPGSVYLHAYPADASVTLDDFEIENRVAEVPLHRRRIFIIASMSALRLQSMQ